MVARCVGGGRWGGIRFDLGVPDLEGLSRDELIVLVGVQARRIAELVAANQALTAANEDLAVRLARVEHLLSRNSKNSSSPPSKDDEVGKTGPKPAEGGGGTGRSRGKRPGAAGSHLAFTEIPDDLVERFPEGVCECGHDLAGAADLGVVDRYQETEIPLVVAKVRQFDQHAVRCRCGKVHTAARPDGARSGPVGYGPNLQSWVVYLMVVHHLPTHRCVELLESLTGARPSVGFVHGMLARTAKALAEVDARIRALITLAHVVCMDETPLRVGPRTPRPGRKKAEKYLLVACTRLYTHYLLGDRDLDTFKTSVLTELSAAGAVIVHDRYTVYDHAEFAGDPDNAEFAGVVHQLCCQHLLRDADDAGQVYPEEHWPAQIGDALRGLIHATNLARDQDHRTIDAATRDELLRLLRAGSLPRPPRGHPAVHHQPRHPTHQQRRRTRTTPLQNPAEHLRAPDQHRTHQRPLHNPRLPKHRRQTGPSQDDRPARRHPPPTLDARAPRPYLSAPAHPSPPDATRPTGHHAMPPAGTLRTPGECLPPPRC